MRVLSTAIMTACLAAFASVATACPMARSMQPHDYAIADVIFEGVIKEVFPVKKYNDYLKRDQVVAAKLMFSVEKTLRGGLPQKEVLVGYSPYAQGGPASVEDFVKWHGEKVRVGLITPSYYDKFCKMKMQESWRGGKMIEYKRTVCEFGLPEYTAGVDGIPFIQGSPCSNQFIFDVTKPVNKGHPVKRGRSISIQVFRQKPELFTQGLTKDSAEMKVLLELGMMNYQSRTHYWKHIKEDAESLENLKNHLAGEFMTLASLEEIDPDLRERLLRDDLGNTEH